MLVLLFFAVVAAVDLPGIEFLGKGYDITKYDHTKKMTGATVMEMTYDNKYSWTNPFTNIEYEVVDQIPGPESIKIYGGSVSVQETSFYYNKADLDTLNHDTDLYRYISNEIYNGKYVSISKSVLSSYTLELVPPEMLRVVEFFRILETFPIYNSTTKQTYYKLIKLVGTHYISELSGGSVYYQIASTPMTLSGDGLFSKDYYTTAAGFNILNRIDRDSDVPGNRPVNASWLKYSTVKTYCLGGDNVCPTSAASKKQWILNSFSAPFVSGYTMTELYKLLPERYQLQYRTAVRDYINDVYLDSIIPFYNSITNPVILNLHGTRNLITVMELMSVRGNISSVDWVFRDSCNNPCCNSMKPRRIVECNGYWPQDAPNYYEKYMKFKKNINEAVQKINNPDRFYGFIDRDYEINFKTIMSFMNYFVGIYDHSMYDYWEVIGFSRAAERNVSGYCIFDDNTKCNVDAVSKATSIKDDWLYYIPNVLISFSIKQYY